MVYDHVGVLFMPSFDEGWSFGSFFLADDGSTPLQHAPSPSLIAINNFLLYVLMVFRMLLYHEVVL
jgi:hypothetical protein